jgi:hypothetical protein
MRLDHVSYVASHDQISDVVNRIGSQIGTAFVDGGIHPKFGTRNFTAPLLNGQYIEIVCPLDHPATDATPFGQAVKNKAAEGGGWLAWVFSTPNINFIEKAMNKSAAHGARKKPNGDELFWYQIGVNNLKENPSYPFFVEWKSNNHPAFDGIPAARITGICFYDYKYDVIHHANLQLSDLTFDLNIEFEGSNEFTGIKHISFIIEDKVVIIN